MMLQSTPDDNYKEKDYRFSVGTNENLDRDNFAVSVNTQLGLFVGTNNDERFTNTDFVTNGVDSFLGIKYGRIPGRFRKSQLYEQRRDFIDATDFGPFCWQSVDMPWYEDQQQSEDVSALLVWICVSCFWCYTHPMLILSPYAFPLTVSLSKYVEATGYISHIKASCHGLSSWRWTQLWRISRATVIWA